MFKSHLRKYCNLKNIYNYYGMVEQTGSIFFECNKGYFHTSIFNDVLIRDKFDLSLSKNTTALVVKDTSDESTKIQKAKKLLNYEPQFTLSQGLKEAVKWYWKNYK